VQALFTYYSAIMNNLMSCSPWWY